VANGLEVVSWDEVTLTLTSRMGEKAHFRAVEALVSLLLGATT